MKKYTLQGILIFTLGLGIGCFLNLDKLSPWYFMQSSGEGDPVMSILNSAQELRDFTGVTRAVDTFDCSSAFLFNDIYKDNTKCLEEEFRISSSTEIHYSDDLRLALAALSAEQRRQLVQSLYQWLQRHGQGVVNAGYSPDQGNGPQLAVTSTGSMDNQMELGLNTGPENTQKLRHTPSSILVVGDSLALGLAKSFERALKEYNEDIDFARVGKVSSGLAIPHLFDWEKKVQVLIDKYKPDLIVVMMGVNDANNNIHIDNKKAILGTAAWPDAYQKRVERFIAIIAGNSVPTYWVSLPVVRDTAMSQRIQIANEAAKKACEAFDLCNFVDTADILTDDNGNYTNYKKDDKGYSIRIRAKDGIHFSTDGGDLLSRYILNYISNYVELRPKARAEKSI